jgi:hypothetical protein
MKPVDTKKYQKLPATFQHQKWPPQIKPVWCDSEKCVSASHPQSTKWYSSSNGIVVAQTTSSFAAHTVIIA